MAKRQVISRVGLRVTIWSESQSESRPTASAASAYLHSDSGSGSPYFHWPKPTPILMPLMMTVSFLLPLPQGERGPVPNRRVLLHWRKRRRDQNLIGLADQELPRFGWPGWQLHRLRANTVSLRQVLVGPDMNELVEPANLTVPASRQRRESHPLRNRCCPSFFYCSGGH